MPPVAGELVALLREIRDRLPPPVPPAARPRLFERAHRRVKEIEPWGILLAVVGLFLALITFWIDYRDRVEERTVRAWQLLTTPAPGNSGKREALEYLNQENGVLGLCFEVLRGLFPWQRSDHPAEEPSSCLVPLKGRTRLTGISLSPSDNGTPDDPSDDPLGPYLRGVSLAGAVLWDAGLAGAYLEDADLAGAALGGADLAGAILRGVSLAGTILGSAHLAGADLRNADLAGADLRNADLTDALLSGTRFADEESGPACNLTQAQLDQAWAWADQPPVSLDRLDPSLTLPKTRLCDPELRGAWEDEIDRRPPRGERHYGPPAGCSGAGGAGAAPPPGDDRSTA